MKALDTPVLVDLLRGRPAVWKFLDRHRAEELVTTEINLYELEVMARHGPPAGRQRRLDAVATLRRKLTVLPIDDRAASLALRADPTGRAPVAESLMQGAAEAAGCGSWVTTTWGRLPKPGGKLKVEYIGD